MAVVLSIKMFAKLVQPAVAAINVLKAIALAANVAAVLVMIARTAVHL
jgi:hypothetical protein